ncbi:MAG: aromatic ring-hydroxylating dioxygenase subunit alpha [Rhodobacteraceae bacterium]|nr:aromatic ring-hydroxylating dioxygenase subunit alpha [Paracoccaceae bacterium]
MPDRGVETAAGLPDSWDRSGLPGWTYFSEKLLRLEYELIFRCHWQCVCHVSDVPRIGDYMTFDIADERALIIRGRDGVIRAFHNLCRHRGSRVVAHQRGNCPGVIACPFHGWSYNLDGSLRGIARRDNFPPLDNDEWGLKPVEMEIWNSFVFVRFKPGPQPGVASVMARVEAEVSNYRLRELLPASGRIDCESIEVNWKSVRDVDNEGYHVAQAHPGLHDLYGKGYFDEPYIDGVARSVGPFDDGPGRSWSVRSYKRILPHADWLPDSHQSLWLYVGMFPNLVFGFYPDSVIFYQEIPISARRTVQRSAIYRYPDESRALRLARYLSGRIDRDAVEEDRMLAVWSSEAVHSSAFDGICLSNLEYGMKTFHDHLRALIPAMELAEEPSTGGLA